MKQTLISGGIYSANSILNGLNGYLIYLKEIDNRLYFFGWLTEKVKQNDFLNSISSVLYSKESDLLEMIEFCDKEYFLKNVDGFIGKVPDLILTRLLELEFCEVKECWI